MVAPRTGGASYSMHFSSKWNTYESRRGVSCWLGPLQSNVFNVLEACHAYVRDHIRGRRT